ncbi:hypothetical protein GZ77_02315 [Endozoicomonas montiporae]|uniref:Glycosyl transferase family 1 n=2 Tax=Endozoicomonas montiporae TaxID=1027273 RepID=A0A081NAL7_9GAMM|nr:glycosyltransferase family 1 protein [Endozoicomonas montiporae]AMO56828.1 group 1 glycosyl transferase [Endozoicomonas montiporae CL-33]KEQ15490.1 hypothetical protein GZ77_02315 [Endozoicomonas montiporae]
MRIGIDARLLSEQITGIGRYTGELSRELVSLPGEFFLYCGSPVGQYNWTTENVTLRTANSKNRAARMLWSQTTLPTWANQDNVDVFWGATHRLPKFLPESVAKVVTIHDLVWKHAGETMRPLSRMMEQLLMPQAVKLADRIVADSESTARAIVTEYPFAVDKVRVVYPGVSILPTHGTFEILDKFAIQRDYFLFVGTLEPRKNLNRLLQAYAILDEDLKQKYPLVIVGGKGWGGVNVENLITRYGLSNHVRKLGYVSEDELANLYAHASFLVMPALYEGFGLPIVEANSFGVPVLTSNTSSMPEVAGDAGILIDPYSIRSIASGLRTMMDSKQRDLLAARAKNNATRFTWEKAARDLWSVFEEALEVKRSTF